MNFSFLLPVIAGAVGAMVVGAIWYARSVFGTKWIALHGFDVSDPVVFARMQKESMRALRAHMVGLLVMSYVFAALFKTLHVTSLAGALAFAGVMWIGFVAPFSLPAPLFAHKPRLLGVIDGVHQLVAMLVMAGIIVTLQ